MLDLSGWGAAGILAVPLKTCVGTYVMWCGIVAMCNLWKHLCNFMLKWGPAFTPSFYQVPLVVLQGLRLRLLAVPRCCEKQTLCPASALFALLPAEAFKGSFSFAESWPVTLCAVVAVLCMIQLRNRHCLLAELASNKTVQLISFVLSLQRQEMVTYGFLE